MSRIEVTNDAGQEGAGNRNLGGALGHAVRVIAVSFALFHLYTAGFGNFPNLIQRSIHVGFGLVLVFALYSLRGKATTRISVLDWVFILGTLVSTFWVAWNYDRFMSRQAITTTDLVLGLLTLVAVMEAARRVIGIVFSILALVFIGYALFGPMIPMPFAHRGFSVTTLVSHLYTTDLGLWGVTTSVSATVVAVFIVFGSLLFFSGGGATFMNIALLIAGRSVGGPAKVATIASALFGTISGSAAANVAVTGSFTIPMMRRLNYSRDFAAGVEATASTGGQLMPPIMGAAAFIMAELLGMPYLDIVTAALIPALLMYGGVLVAVHFGSVRRGYLPLTKDEIPEWRDALALRRLIPLLGPIAVLMWFLFSGATPQRSGFAAIVAAILFFLAQDIDPAAWRDRAVTVLRALEGAGYALIMIAVLAATAQIVIGIIGLTGVGVRFTSILISASEGNLLLALMIAMAVALILGMGMPTTGAYLLAASVLAPALVRMGVEPLQAHLFVFYFAIISAITPPVCAAVFVAAGIAQSSWFRSSLIAVRLGLVAFIIPYMFVYSPALLMEGEAGRVIFASATAALGVVALAAGVMGQFLTRSMIWESALFVAGALLLIRPGLETDLGGAAAVSLGLGLQVMRRRSANAVPVKES